MAKLTLNSISQDIFAVNNAASERENIIGMGRAIAFDYAARATNDLHSALKIAEKTDRLINGAQYSALNKKFQQPELPRNPYGYLHRGSHADYPRCLQRSSRYVRGDGHGWRW